MVLDFAPKDTHGIRMVRCACECGKESIAGAYAVKSGAIKSCGCLTREINQSRKGERRPDWNGYRSPDHPNRNTYSSWQSMKKRCLDPNSTGYANYGGKGITVCRRWLESFLNFVEDMGERPQGTTIDRWPDREGDYEPSNCRWATGSEQCYNRSISRPITIGTETKFLGQWCEQFGIGQTTVNQRERYGWDIITALTTPVQQRRTNDTF